MPTPTNLVDAEVEALQPSDRVPAPDVYITLSGIDWETFDGIANRTRGGRVRYSDGELEIISPSLRHEDFGDRLRDLVAAFCGAMGIEAMALGSTTWKAPSALKGVEADAAFYLDSGKVAASSAGLDAAEEDVTKLPAPDLVIEIDMRRPDADRSAVYAAVGAVEIWEFDGAAIRIRRLRPNGSYVEVLRSGWFPVTAQEIATAIADAPRSNTARRRFLRAFTTRMNGDREPDR